MRLSAITLARVLAFVETNDLDSRGKIFLPDLLLEIAKRFRFQKFPQKIEEMDESKGVQFQQGTWNGVTVGQLTIFNNLIWLDTNSSTSDSERIIEEALLWASEQFKLEYKPDTIKRKRYLSSLTFYSEMVVPYQHPAIINLSKSLNKAVVETTGHDIVYDITRLDLDFCRFEKNFPIAPFTVQRRSETPFSENKYFSEAPLPTEIHIRLLEQLERELIG